VERATGGGEERGARCGGAHDGQGRGASSEQQAAQVGCAMARERTSEWRKVGARWENAVAASGMRRGVRTRIRDMEINRE
jgi:hypothetical protein